MSAFASASSSLSSGESCIPLPETQRDASPAPSPELKAFRLVVYNNLHDLLERMPLSLEEKKAIRNRASSLAREHFLTGHTTREDVLLLVEHALEPVLKKDAPRVTETFERGSGI